MKSLFFLCLMFAFETGCVCGQDSALKDYFQELMEDALHTQKNRAPDEMIHCEVKKKITYDDFTQLKKNHERNIFFCDYSMKKDKIISFDFIPKKNWEEFVYSKWKPDNIPFSELKNIGSLFTYLGDGYDSQHLSLSARKEEIDGKVLLRHFSNVKWSGDVVGGFIHGEGVGVVGYYPEKKSPFEKNDRMHWLYVKGKFNNGFPVGTQTNRFYVTYLSSVENWGPLKDLTFTLSEFDDNREAVLMDANGNSLARINKAGEGRLLKQDEEKYLASKAISTLKSFYNTNDDFTKMENSKLVGMENLYILCQSPYDNLHFVSQFPSKRFIDKDFKTIWKEVLDQVYSDIINTGKSNLLTTEVKYTDGIGNAVLIPISKKYVTKWRSEIQHLMNDKISGLDEILMMIDIADGLYLTNDDMIKKFDNMLYSRPVLRIGPSLFAALNRSNYWEVLNRAIENSEKLKALRPDMMTKLDVHKKTLNDWKYKSHEMYYEAAKWQEKQNKNEEEAYAAYKANMCENCKIDGSKTTFPSGYVDKWEFLFLTVKPAQSEKEGRIVLVNGETVSWKYIYHDNGRSKIEIRGAYDGEYDSVNEMMADIVEKCKMKYCY